MTADRSEQSPGGQQAPKVLLVAAEPSLYGGLGRGLRRRGCALHLVSTAREGLERGLSIGPDVLVLAEPPADSSGVELLRSVRREQALDVVPVIVLSARPEAAARIRALRAGANDVVAPPFDAGELVERIVAHARMGQARRAATEKARSEERRLLAREVHDRLGQLLTAANIDIRLLERRAQDDKQVPPREELLRELRSALSSIDQAIASVQDIALLLRPPEIEAGGLAAALRWQAGEFERRFQLDCTLRHAEAGYVEPAPSVAYELFRICQEALTNVLRHADATQVQVQLAVRGRHLLLRVCDNGVGISRGAGDAPAAIGIAGMRERAASIGASLHIRGRPGCGTILSVRRRLALP
jgi:signal transduction histidine kinase